jgi:hypothetical protein
MHPRLRSLRAVWLAALAAALFASGSDARAQWCAYYEPMIYNCGFRTFAQCAANVSGVGGLCSRDRRYVEPAEAPRKNKKRQKNK